MLTKQLQRKELLQKNANEEPVSSFTSPGCFPPQIGPILHKIKSALDMLDMRILRALLFFLLLLSGDVESNPGPPKKGKMFDSVAIVHTLLEP